MAAEGKPKTVEELSVEMKQHGWRHQFFYEEDQDQWTLLITCTLEVVSRDKDLRKWFFAVDIRDSEVSNHRNELTASFC
jgi:hypothetical protein